jgi:hypothetical protein
MHRFFTQYFFKWAIPAVTVNEGWTLQCIFNRYYHLRLNLYIHILSYSNYCKTCHSRFCFSDASFTPSSVKTHYKLSKKQNTLAFLWPHSLVTGTSRKCWETTAFGRLPIWPTAWWELLQFCSQLEGRYKCCRPQPSFRWSSRYLHTTKPTPPHPTPPLPTTIILFLSCIISQFTLLSMQSLPHWN